jgi:hypothetical protein
MNLLILGIVPFVLGLGMLLYTLWWTTTMWNEESAVSFADTVTIVGLVIIGTLSWSFGLGIISRVLSLS